MIKVTVLYPNEQGKKFDMDYWITKHVPMVGGLLEPMGMVKAELDKGVSGTDPNAPPPYIAVAHLYFNTVEEVHEAFKAHGGQIMGDIKNYTDITPQFQISELLT